MWVEFVVGSRPCSERFFSPLLKNQHFKIPIRSGLRGPRVCQYLFKGKEIRVLKFRALAIRQNVLVNQTFKAAPWFPVYTIPLWKLLRPRCRLPFQFDSLFTLLKKVSRKPIRYVTIDFQDRSSATSPRHKNRSQIGVLCVNESPIV